MVLPSPNTAISRCMRYRSKRRAALTAERSPACRAHKVLVMTPAILVERLTCRSLCLENVPLLVFDEAHHCRKNHAYRQIMQMYDSLPAGAPRPHIFGMTACPVNSKVRRDCFLCGFGIALGELELWVCGETLEGSCECAGARGCR